MLSVGCSQPLLSTAGVPQLSHPGPMLTSSHEIFALGLLQPGQHFLKTAPHAGAIPAAVCASFQSYHTVPVV